VASGTVLAGMAVSTYPPGIAWAVVIGTVCAWRAWRSSARRQDMALVAVAAAAAAIVVLFSRLWWTGGPQRIVAGGGTIDGSPIEHALNLVRQLAVSGESYYFFGRQPAFGSAVLAVVVVAAGLAAWQRCGVGPWYAVAGLTVLMWLPTGNLPGVRRAIALSVMAALVLAVAADVAWRRWPRQATAAVLVPLGVTAAGWQQDYRGGQQTLVADFPIAPGPMPPTFAAWDADLRSGQLTVEDMVADHDGLRTLAVVWMLADRQGRGTDGLPTPREIVAATIDPALLPE
jgi:hypothetical protein